MMRFLRIVGFFICMAGIFAGTIYVEKKTPIVQNVKHALGLKVAPRSVEEASDRPSVLALAKAFLSGEEDAGTIMAMITKGAGPEQHLPEPLTGWMREDQQLHLGSVADFREQFIPGSRDAVQSETEGSVDLGSIANVQLASSGVKIYGATYFNEGRLLMVSITRMSKNDAWGQEQILKNSRDIQAKIDQDRKNSFRVGNKDLYVERDRRTGYGEVDVVIDERYQVKLQGTASNLQMRDFLLQMPLVTDAFIEETVQRRLTWEHKNMIPEALPGWSGEPKVFTYDEVLDFDARYAPDGSRVQVSDEERGYLKAVENAGMAIGGAIYRRGGMELLVTLTRLPLEGGDLPSSTVLIGAGMLQLTRTFDTKKGEMVMFGGEEVATSYSPQVNYREFGKVVGGVYLYQIRGNAPMSVVRDYVAALDWHEVRADAKRILPEWK